MHGRFCAAAARTRLERGSHGRDPVSLGGGTRRALGRNRNRIRPAQGRCYCQRWKRGRRGKAGVNGRSDRLHDGGRSGWHGSSRKSGATGRQYHRPGTQSTGPCGQATRGLRRVAIIANVEYPFAMRELAEFETAARTLGLEVAPLEIRRAEDIAPAFEALKNRAEALYVVGDALVTTHRIRINTLALTARVPTIYVAREFVEGGGLMSYGPNFPDLFRRAADRSQSSNRPNSISSSI